MHLQSKSLDIRPIWWYTNTCGTIFSLIVLRGDVRGYQLQEIMEALIDKDMKKKDLQVSAGISWASVTKLSKGEPVSMDVLIKVCKALDCNIGDIVDFIPEDQ